MSRFKKLKERLLSEPRDLTFEELEAFLGYLGYRRENKGRTSGSRVSFVNSEAHMILLHRPHPGNVLPLYQIKQIIAVLKEEDLI